MYLFSTGKNYYDNKSCQEVREIMNEYVDFMNDEFFLAKYSELSNEILYYSKFNAAKEKAQEEGFAKGVE